VKDARILDSAWRERHFKTIASAYARAPHFADYHDSLEELYRGATSPSLSEVNRHFLEGLMRLLGIRTRLTWSMDYDLPPSRIERLIALCRQAGATSYLSGPSARAYIDPQVFVAAGIGLAYMDYGVYPEYPQLHPPFTHFVSLIDLLLTMGPAALEYMKSASASAVSEPL
jgi:hypothetical protein